MSRARSIGAALIGVSTMCGSAAAQPLDSCGTLVSGVNQCVLFRLGDGTSYLLDNEGGYAVGGQVHVVGTIQPTCFSSCNQGNGCVTVQSIGPCVVQIIEPSLPGDRCGSMCGVALPGALTSGLLGWGGARWLRHRRAAVAARPGR
ncbi:MAG: hypothetical protein U1A27_02205 [Phycisphaerae bacterium]